MCCLFVINDYQSSHGSTASSYFITIFYFLFKSKIKNNELKQIGLIMELLLLFFFLQNIDSFEAEIDNIVQLIYLFYFFFYSNCL